MSTSPQAGQITFIQHELPPLPSGEYTVTLTQHVHISEIDYQGATIPTNESDDHSASISFYVRGERFRLQSSNIQSVFPPANGAGEYANALPHVVLTQPRLPWAWTLSGGPQVPDPNGDVTTWMALLVFDAEDPAPAAVTRTLADLAEPPSGVVSYPHFALAPGEARTDAVVTLDVPVALWNQIAPSPGDLEHLAHCRVVSPACKASDPCNAQNEYSVVIANRLPSGQKSTIHLVCLEGLASYLPGSSQHLPPGAAAIRLASLMSFQVSAGDEATSFTAAMQRALNPNLPATLRLPSSSSQDPRVINALAMGYTACSHQTRLGATIYSWYRGPLVPFAASTSSRLTSPARNADALLRYNPETGMFDASYSAAWQLGRLLALQNKEYAMALYRWRHDSQAGSAPPPDIVTHWLGRLALLFGIPFNYLVPDERMLPADALRFFQVDPLWMDCLMDGAFSMGRSTSAALTHDAALIDQIRAGAIAAARKMRPTWLEQAGAGSGGGETASPGDGTISGFLLRSEVLTTHPGVEMRGFAGTDPNDEGAPLAMLRYETLSPNVRLCMFDGTVGHIKFRQPSEGLHFGLDSTGNAFNKRLRALSSGQEIDTTVSVDFRAGNKDVVDIASLASSIARALQDTSFTSDKFALEMVESVQEVFFVQQS
jgi:hypothetical protein